MSSPEKRTPTRRSTRSVSKSPLKARLEEAAASPLPSHPIRPEPSPPEEAKPRRTPRRSTRAAKREASDSEGEQPAAAGKGAGAGKGAPAASAGGASPLLLLLAVLAVGAAVIFARFNGYLDLPPKPYRAASTADGDSPRGKQRRPSLLDFEPIPQPVPPSPPLPPITPEEIAAFEQAAEEHYGMPPGTQPGFRAAQELELVRLSMEPAREAAEGVAALDQEWEQEQGEDATEHQQLQAGTGSDAAEAAAAAFDSATHQAYLDLPTWPEATEEELTGSWTLTQEIYDYAARLPMAQVLSWEEPRLVLFPSFLSPEEVGHMIDMSRDHLERSEVLVAEGEEAKQDVRTSFGFWPDSDDVTTRITERIHRTLGIPHDFGEGLYVLNYQIGQKYEAHNDHCMDGFSGNKVADAACRDFLKRAGGPQCGPGQGGPTCGDRVATFILYLKSPTRGGQTSFPDAEATKQALGAEHRGGNTADDWYCHDERVLQASPPPGTGVLFWDYRPGSGSGTGSYKDGTADPMAQTVYAAMHSGCPVLEGEKYVMTRWIRGSGFDYPRGGVTDGAEFEVQE